MQMAESISKETKDSYKLKEFVKLAKIFPEPLALVKSSGEILFANNSFRQKVRHNDEDLTGNNIKNLVLNGSDEVEEYLRKCSRTRQFLIGKLNFFDKEGAISETVCEGAVYKPAGENSKAEIILRIKKTDGGSKRFALLTQNIEQLNKEISIRKEAEERNEELYKQAAEANRLKDEFLSTVSLELRTPLNALLGWTRMLRTGKISQELFEEALETIEVTVLSQSELIENLLDVSKIVTGKLNIDAENIDFGEIVDKVLNSVRPTIDNKSINLETDIAFDPIMISGDSERLRQVIWNLIANAIKFTPNKGTVQVELKQKDNLAVLKVKDNGKGISPEFLPFVFERFLKEENEEKNRYGGLGLGLSIVKYLVELHGGRAEAISQGEDKGAEFIISLPVAEES